MFRHHGFWFLIIALAVVGFAFYSLKQQSLGLKPTASKPAEIALPKSPGEIKLYPADPVWGSRLAPVKIIVYSDFQCPYCAESDPLLKEMVNNSSGKAVLVWKDFPLPNHAQAYAAAEAAQCASSQGRFWEFHDKLFLNQSSLGSTLYQQLASDLKLNVDKFLSCISNKEAVPLINQNINEAKSIGVDGTPTLIINGQVYNGTLTKEQLNLILNSVTTNQP
ncbi:MAG: thioredoxin domain-containing protein [Candidatus Kerfeldbacteria bacterium]|nr:thioredoxin domain-containing protein [Candidatus Kerfeldbacteria bacterium]